MERLFPANFIVRHELYVNCMKVGFALGYHSLQFFIWNWAVQWWSLPLNVILFNLSHFFTTFSESSNKIHLFLLLLMLLILLLSFQLLIPPSLETFIREPVSIQTNLGRKKLTFVRFFSFFLGTFPLATFVEYQLD